MIMKSVKVLRTASGSPSAPGGYKSLKCNGEREIIIIGTDMKDDPSIRQYVDIFYKVPAVNDPNYVDVLLEICRKEKVDVVMPGISAELPLLEARRNEFEAIGTKVSVTDRKGLLIANDKLKLYEFMKEHDLKVPNFEKADTIEELLIACERLGYPNKAVCIKMKDGSGSRGIRIINPKQSRYDIFVGEKPNSFYTTLDDMVSMFKEAGKMPELMVMEFLPGMEYSVDVLANHGKIDYMIGRESNVILASIPQEATLAPNEEAYKIAEDVISALELDGNLDLDFKFDENGHPQLMEINPRTAATMSIFSAGGVNLTYLRVKQLLGEPLPKLDVKYGVKMKRRYAEFFYDKEGNAIYLKNEYKK